MARRSRRQHRREEVSSLCETCGNDLPDGSRRCIYCGSVTASQAPQRARSSHAVANVNIKAGLPTGDEAIARLDSGLAMARASGARVARIVHGYGSSGTGGVIRERVRQQLASLRARGTVRDFVAGEEFAISTESGDRLLRACPELNATLVQDRHNPGITFVLL